MNKRKSLIFTILGNVLTGFAIGSFLTPNKIVGGGASGISTILYHTFGFQPGISYFVLNIVFLLVGLKVLGKTFITKTLFGITLLSVFAEIFSYIPIYTENLILPAIFGGVLYGLGIGLSFAAGASTGGTDIIGRIIQTKFSSVPIGRMLLCVDGVIILASLLVFKNVELALYGIITLFITSFAIDFVINSFNISNIAFVITDKGEEISNKLVSTSPRGVTLIDVKGVYTHSQKQMLFCALKEIETQAFEKKILEIDGNAFIVFAQSQKIKGNGFYLYK